MVVVVRQLKMGLTDNFCQLIATDNYLEKYLPFRIQNMVSASVHSILSSNQEQQRRFRVEETKTYKQLHKLVLLDDGIPTLKKRSFQMPNQMRKLQEESLHDCSLGADQPRKPNQIFELTPMEHEANQATLAKGLDTYMTQ